MSSITSSRSFSPASAASLALFTAELKRDSAASVFFARVLAVLNRAYDLSIFSSAPDSRHYLQAFFWNYRQRIELPLYYFTASDNAEFLERAFCLWPGIAVFQDLNLLGYLLANYRHSTVGVDLDAAMQKRFGSKAPPLGTYLQRGVSPELYSRLYPLCGAVLNRADLILVQSSYQRSFLARAGFNAIAVGFPLSPRVELLAANERAASAEKFGFGPLSAEQRIVLIGPAKLSRLEELKLERILSILYSSSNTPNSLLLVRPTLGAEALAENLSEPFNVKHLRLKSEAEFKDLLALASGFLDLSSEPLSGISYEALLALEAGCPLICPRLGAAAHFLPDSLRLTYSLGPDGESEAALLLKNISALSFVEQEYRLLLQAHLLEQHSSQIFNGKMLDILEAYRSQPKPERENCFEEISEAREALLSTSSMALTPEIEAQQREFMRKAAADFSWCEGRP